MIKSQTACRSRYKYFMNNSVITLKSCIIINTFQLTKKKKMQFFALKTLSGDKEKSFV